VADPARSEPATPRRKQEARKRGQIARSAELTAAVLLLAVLLFFRFLGNDLITAMGREAVLWWGAISGKEMTLEGIMADLTSSFLRIFIAMAPLFLLVVLVAVLGNVGQFGLLFSAAPITPNVDNINPVMGFQRIFSLRTSVELVKAVVKLAIIGWVSYSAFRATFDQIAMQSARPLQATFAAAVEMSWSLGLKIVLALIAIAVLDYIFQRYEYERRLRMTRQEVKDEYRQLEGDPLIRARIRQLQREAARRRMVSEVPRADVVITNPVHLAVAVRYDPQANKPPVIVAKGARLVAERIKELAKSSGVPIYEDPPLAQALFEAPVGAEVPSALYHAIAQVLAFVYHTSRREKERQVLGGVMGAPARQAAYGG